MAHTTNRTFICSVVFLDIVDYSQQPVDEQILLKSRFNVILAEAIKDVAVNDRIILDTGDGAAISFLGDPEDALFVALSIRDAIIGGDGSTSPHLSARIGINLGPVKLVQDINGQRNLIGDGINVAQRVMSFTEPGQVLVSRSYFEVISRLSQEYAKLFHYEGSRADKHVREHQVYSVHPVEKEKAPPPAPPVQRKEERPKEEQSKEITADAEAGVQSDKTVTAEEGQPLRIPQPSSWQQGGKKMLDGLSLKSLHWDAIRNSRKALYVAAALIVILVSVPIIVWRTVGTPGKDQGTVLSPTSVAKQEAARKTETPVEAKRAEAPVAAKKAETLAAAKKLETPEADRKAETPAAAKKLETPEADKKAEAPAVSSEEQKKTDAATTPERPAATATVSFGIAPWGEVYVDGIKKGVSPPLNSLQVTPGRRLIEIRNTTFPPYKQTVEVKPGDQLKIMHKFR